MTLSAIGFDLSAEAQTFGLPTLRQMSCHAFPVHNANAVIIPTHVPERVPWPGNHIREFSCAPPP